MTKAELQERVDILGQLLFEAVHLLRTEQQDLTEGEWEDRQIYVYEFLLKCQKERIV